MALLAKLDHAGVDLGGRTVLQDVSFRLEEGRVSGVTGPNGSGKTTLVRTLATLVRLDRGDGEVLGADLTTDEVYAVRGQIGLIGHVPALHHRLTLRENLAHAARLGGLATSRVDAALHSVGLEDAADRMADAGSFGMKRRLEVARLLLQRPRLLLLDEATSGLDPAAIDIIDALVERTLSEGGGAVMVSHDEAALQRVCDDVAVLSVGRMGTAT